MSQARSTSGVLTQSLVCRPSRFYRIPLQHATFYGLCKGLCELINRPKDSKLAEGDHIRLSEESLAKIADNLRNVQLPSQFTGPVKNPFTCAASSS